MRRVTRADGLMTLCVDYIINHCASVAAAAAAAYYDCNCCKPSGAHFVYIIGIREVVDFMYRKCLCAFVSELLVLSDNLVEV